MMNIDQLIERYFNADTTIDEERLLREFFAKRTELPAHLEQYRAIFLNTGKVNGESLDDSFNHRVMEALETHGKAPVFRAKGITMRDRLSPMFRVAACVAIILSVMMAAEQGMRTPTHVDVVVPSNAQTIGCEISEVGTPVTEITDTIVSNQEQDIQP